jgi:gamma-glutamylcyclotransferase
MTLKIDADSFLYFAYGSNMSASRLTAPTRAPSARLLCSGYVTGRRLTFDKVSKDGSGKCDCELTGNSDDRVYGVLFSIHRGERIALDRAEGAGYGYDRMEIQVHILAGPVSASTYVATDKLEGLRPYHWYKQHVLNGARAAALPADYVNAIANVESIPDPDEIRAARESAAQHD